MIYFLIKISFYLDASLIKIIYDRNKNKINIYYGNNIVTTIKVYEINIVIKIYTSDEEYKKNYILINILELIIKIY